MAVLVWKRNPDHFVRGNIHGLHIGAHLRLPDDVKQALADLSPDDAQQIAADQWEVWQQPRRATVVA
jgi:Tfp pilus assembly protein FimV